MELGEGDAAILERMAKRADPAGARSLRESGRKIIRAIFEPSNPPILSPEVSSAAGDAVERLVNKFALLKGGVFQVGFDQEQVFVRLVTAAIHGGDLKAMVYRNRTFALDLRVSDNLRGIFGVPTPTEIKLASLKRRGTLPSRLDRQVNVAELLKYNDKNSRWELHQAIRDVTLDEFFN